MLNVAALSKTYGDQTLFEDISFSLSPGERLGLVGRNGSGKSTLFRLILGEESPDDGRIILPRGYRVGHLAQHLVFREPNIVKEVCLGLPEDERDQEYRGEIILGGLGFSEDDMHRQPSEFSGGFQIRLNLAKLLLSEPNLLLLDEPTNYLDIVSVRWLTTFLRAWKNELIIISHDRLFMDDVTTHTMLIHRGGIRKIAGGTEKLYSQVEQDEEIYEKTRLNEDKKRKDLELFISRFRAQASKATLVQSKIKMLERMGQKDELSTEEQLDFVFREAPFSGKTVLEARDISFGYDKSSELFKDFNVTIKHQDRIGVIGKNGKGKSTLLRLLNGELTPSKGDISLNQNSVIGYFGQTNIARLSPRHTVEEEISLANQQLHKTAVRAICGTMMFSGDDALKKISVLSGGEKSRVLLGRILALRTNFLLLDEPTNHLDMESIEALIDSIKQYQGTVVIVTHSELILRELATRLIVFEGDTPQVIEHDYAYFLDEIGWEEERSDSKPSKHTTAPKKTKPVDHEKIAERKVASIEKKVQKLEAELKEAEEQLRIATESRDVELITSISLRIVEIHEEIDKHLAEL